MKKFGIALGLGLAFAAASTARAAEPGPYIGLGAALHLPESTYFDADITVGPTTTTVPGQIKFETGYGLIGAVGYRFEDFRTELEVSYRIAGADGVDGNQSSVSGMFNVLFDVGVAQGIYPYIGGGVGIANTRWDSVQSGTGPIYHDSSAKFQWQAIVGAEMPVSSRTDVFLDYRYSGATDNTFSGGPAARVYGADNMSHNIILGVRFRFGGTDTPIAAAPPPAPPPPPVAAAPPPPAPAPAPVAAVPPPPPPVPQNFLVFFDFDRADVRTDAQKIIAEAADYAKQTGKARIMTTGHADTSGSPTYNLALSERRAQAVKASLVQMGFADNEISVASKGEAEPLVQTGDGVREPQNRRVEIVMN